MKKGLGRGLEAIFEENRFDIAPANPVKEGAEMLRLADIEPNREQPRRQFDEQALEQLAASIEKHGLLQPLLVEPIEGGRYRIIAGERRWRACRMAGVKEVPAVVRSVSAQQMMELALIENLQREDLNPIEEAQGYKQLIELYHMTQDQVAASVGKSRPAITNAIRLLSLPQEVLQFVQQGVLSAGHARALLGTENTDTMLTVAKQVMQQGLSVRQTEQMVAQTHRKNRVAPKTMDMEVIQAIEELEKNATSQIGNQVRIRHTVSGRGKVEIPYYSVQELEKIISAIMKGGEGYGA